MPPARGFRREEILLINIIEPIKQIRARMIAVFMGS